MKNIALFGASGLIGSNLLELLLNDSRVETIHLALRKNIHFQSSKIKIHLIDFCSEEEYLNVVKGCDTVFISIGTTQNKVKGNLEAYRKVDYDIPVFAGKAASKEGVNALIIVSSVGANAQSGNFYLKLKGEVEEKLKALKIKSIYFMQPSMLLGKRSEFRMGERVGQVIMRLFKFLIPEKYKPVWASDVAKTMHSVGQESQPGIHTYTYKNFIHAKK